MAPVPTRWNPRGSERGFLRTSGVSSALEVLVMRKLLATTLLGGALCACGSSHDDSTNAGATGGGATGGTGGTAPTGGMGGTGAQGGSAGATGGSAGSAGS